MKVKDIKVFNPDQAEVTNKHPDRYVHLGTYMNGCI